MIPDQVLQSTATRRLTSNLLWNFAGQALPLLVAAIAIPLLLRGMGTTRFGLLTLAWIVVGYLSMIDLGMARAVTKVVAELAEQMRLADVATSAWTAFSVLSMLGVAFGALLAVSAPVFLGHFGRIPPSMLGEAIVAAQTLAIGLPAVVASAGLRGVLEGLHRFDLVAPPRAVLGLANYLAPLAVLPFTSDLRALTAVLVVSRYLYLVVAFASCWLVLPEFGRLQPPIRIATLRSLLSFGAWITVSNVLAAFLSVIDRLVIAAVASIGVVAYYSIPLDATTRLWVVPATIVGVAYPALTATLVSNRHRALMLFWQAHGLVFGILLLPILVLIGFSAGILTLWLGQPFAERAAAVFAVLTVGVFANCLGQVPFAAIQAAGRPDLTAKLHLAETGPYVVALWLLTAHLGPIGAAIAWSARAIVDGALLYALCFRVLDMPLSEARRPVATAFTAIMALSIFAMVSPLLAGLLAAIALVPASVVAYRSIPVEAMARLRRSVTFGGAT